MPSRRLRAVLVLLVTLLAAFAVPSAAQPPPLTTWPYRTGYVAMSDGTQLRYTVFLPAQTGSFPTLLQYDAYAAGTNPYENGQNAFGARMLAKGYAILGVNTRGSGCSSGTFDMFEDAWSRDGHDVIEWAASQPWSTGDVGMFGVSLPAIMSLYVGATRPPHLRAIAPAATISDIYRDVAYPGGMFNQSFTGFWTAGQKGGYQDPPLVVAEDGDARCLEHMTAQNAPDKLVPVQAIANPYADTFWPGRSLGARIADVDVPVLSMTSWQDEQVGSRVVNALRTLDLATSWHVVTNGNHGVSVVAPDFADLQEAFFERYVRGVTNGFETSTPHVQVWHELPTPSYAPRWVTSHATWPAAVAATYHLTAGGGLTTGAPAASTAPFVYPAPGTAAPSAGGDTPAETAPYQAPAHGVTFTSGAFTAPVELFGPASADLWVSSTATDTDLQVTVSEVRPDGREMFVQRGWLRASHRALDPSSTALVPVHPHTAATTAELTPGTPTPVRVEIWPVGHVFRAGSRLRVTVEAPSATGMRVLQSIQAPAVNTVHTGPLTPSRLVLSTVPATGVVPSYAACDTVVNQPCR